MKGKKLATAIAFMMGATCLWGCGQNNSTTIDANKILEEQETESKESEIFESPSEKEEAASDTRFRINQTAEYNLDNGGKLNVTMTGWGTGYELGNNEPFLRIAYTIENTGEEKVTVGNFLFTVYADDYAADPLVLAEDNKGVATADLSSGRKVDGELYAAINPEEISVIEVELWDSVFVIKDVEKGINDPNMTNSNSESSESNSAELADNTDFDIEWYKKTPNFTYDDGTTLEIIWDDYDNLTFAVSDGTVYYGENNNYDIGGKNTDGTPMSYIYNVTDAETGENDVITYYPPNGLEVPLIGTFTVTQ